MATQTTHYELDKPAYNEAADVAVLNGDLDVIDGAMYENAQGVANAQQSLAIIANGDTHIAINDGQFVYVKGNTHSLVEGLYKATANIAANAQITSSNVTAVSGGGLNTLSDHIGKVYNASGNGISARFVKQEGFVYCCFSGNASSNLTPYANVITLPNDCHTTENIKPAGNAGAQKLYVSSTNQTLMVDSEQISSGTSVKGFIIYPTVSLS